MGHWRSWERATLAVWRSRVRIPYAPLFITFKLLRSEKTDSNASPEAMLIPVDSCQDCTFHIWIDFKRCIKQTPRKSCNFFPVSVNIRLLHRSIIVLFTHHTHVNSPSHKRIIKSAPVRKGNRKRHNHKQHRKSDNQIIVAF